MNFERFSGELAGFEASRTIAFALPKTKTKHALPPAITPRGSDMLAANGSWFTYGYLEDEGAASVVRLVSCSKLWINTDGNRETQLLSNMKTFNELQSFLHIRTTVSKSKTYLLIHFIMVSLEILLISLNFMFIVLLLEKHLPLRIIRNVFCPMSMEGKEKTNYLQLGRILFNNFVFSNLCGLVEQSMSEGHLNLEEICQKFL